MLSITVFMVLTEDGKPGTRRCQRVHHQGVQHQKRVWGGTARTGVAGETAAERELWERYWEVLRVKGVKAGQERWYERSCAQFIREGLSKELGELGEFAPAKRPKRMPVVLNAGVFVEGVVVTESP
jgi:hypothetical protein